MTEFHIKANTTLLEFIKDAVIETKVIKIENPKIDLEPGTVHFDYDGVHYRVDDQYHVEVKDPHGYKQKKVLQTGLTLEEAQRHCSDPETSSHTATSAEAKRRTEEHDPWFDAYYKES